MKIAPLYRRIRYWFSKGESVDSIETFGFSISRYSLYEEIGKLVVCPMKSGRKALLRLVDVNIWQSHDDGYSLEWEFIKYCSK